MSSEISKHFSPAAGIYYFKYSISYFGWKRLFSRKLVSYIPYIAYELSCSYASTIKDGNVADLGSLIVIIELT